MPETATAFEPFYHRHYITVDSRDRITAVWSNGPHPDRDTSGAVCINDRGGCQFRLFPDGEKKPPVGQVPAGALVAAGRLTEEEFREIVGENKA